MSVNFWNSIEKNDVVALQDILKREVIDKGIKDSFGLSPLHLALSKENLDSAMMLIDHSFDVNLQDKNGQTPLHYCAFYGFTSIAERILKAGGKLDISDIYGNQPLWTAIFNDYGKNQRRDIIELFLKYNADLNHMNKVSKSPKDIIQIRQFDNLYDLLR